MVFNMDGGLVERDVAGVNQGGFGNQGWDEVIPVLNFNQDWFFFSGAKGTDLTILQEIWEGQQRLNGRMRHLEDAIHQMNGRVQGNQGHNGNNVNNVNNEVGINELIRLHRSSSSNRHFSVKLARIFFSQNELTNNRTRIGGERRPHGAVNGQLDAARLEQVRINYFTSTRF